MRNNISINTLIAFPFGIALIIFILNLLDTISTSSQPLNDLLSPDKAQFYLILNIILFGIVVLDLVLSYGFIKSIVSKISTYFYLTVIILYYISYQGSQDLIEMMMLYIGSFIYFGLCLTNQTRNKSIIKENIEDILDA